MARVGVRAHKREKKWKKERRNCRKSQEIAQKAAKSSNFGQFFFFLAIFIFSFKKKCRRGVGEITISKRKIEIKKQHFEKPPHEAATLRPIFVTKNEEKYKNMAAGDANNGFGPIP